MSKAKVPKQQRPDTSKQFGFSLPIALLTLGILLIGASFLPLGDWAAESQWSAADSASYDKLSKEYKRSAYQSPARQGLSEDEAKAQRARMQHRIEALRTKLDHAKSQPQRWSRYLLGIGSLLTAAGFFANATRGS